MYLMELKRTVEENGYPSYIHFAIHPGDYLIEFEPAGLSHKGEHGEIRKDYLNKKLEKKENLPLIFKKDKTNPYDKNAVKIYVETESGEKIDCGFVPKYPKLGKKSEHFNQWFYKNLDKFKTPVLTYDSLYNRYIVKCEVKDIFKEERDKKEADEQAKYTYQLYRQWKEEGLPANYGDYIDSGSSSSGYTTHSEAQHHQEESEGCLIGFFKLNLGFMGFIFLLALIKLAIAVAPLLIFLGLIYFIFFRKK